MLRINFAQTDNEQRWTLSGQLRGPWVEELHECWIQLRDAGNAARSIVDLSDVTFVDEGGENLLCEMRSNGVEFIAAGVDTKHLLENLKGEERPLRRFIAPLRCGCDSPRNAKGERLREAANGNEKHGGENK